MARPQREVRILFVLPQESRGNAREAAGAMAWVSWLGCVGEAAVAAIVVARRSA